MLIEITQPAVQLRFGRFKSDSVGYIRLFAIIRIGAEVRTLVLCTAIPVTDAAISQLVYILYSLYDNSEYRVLSIYARRMLCLLAARIVRSAAWASMYASIVGGSTVLCVRPDDSIEWEPVLCK